jgi:hypothetical protein
MDAQAIERSVAEIKKAMIADDHGRATEAALDLAQGFLANLSRIADALEAIAASREPVAPQGLLRRS